MKNFEEIAKVSGYAPDLFDAELSDVEELLAIAQVVAASDGELSIRARAVLHKIASQHTTGLPLRDMIAAMLREPRIASPQGDGAGE